MAIWNKVKFFYDTMLDDTGSTLTATSTESTGDYDVAYLFNFLEVNSWQAEDTAIADPQYITLDLGVGNTATCDYLVILGHNLNTAGVTVTLQSSVDLAFTTPLDAFTGEAPTADTIYHKEFSAPTTQRYWRLKIAGHGSTAPFMGICVWGTTTEVDYVTSSFDPDSQTIIGEVSRAYDGTATGFHTKYRERNLNLTINDASTTVRDKIKTWFEGTWRPFFIKHGILATDDVYHMWTDPTMNNPIQDNGTYWDINLSLKGRKE